METIIVNFAGKAQKRQFRGKEHLVAPLTMIVPGVLNGSQGPLYYPPEEIAKNLASWNNIPIVLNHPESGSAQVSSVLNSTQLGTVFNAFIENESLKAEGWFDVDRTQEISPDVYNALISQTKIELSTGLSLAKTPVENGVSPEGTEYTHSVSNLAPDHLAVLIEQKGACSVEQGCGVFNATSSHEDLRETLGSLLARTFSDDDSYIYITAVYEDKVVYELDDQLYQIGYGKTDGEVFLSDSVPVPVKRMTSFEPVSNNDSTKDSSMSKLTKEERSDIVNELVSNCDCWKKDDVEILNGFDDEKLTALSSAHKERVELKNKGGGEPEPQEPEPQVPTNNSSSSEPRQMTEEEWFSNAPQRVLNTLKYAQGIENRERDEIITKLLKYTPEERQEEVRNQFASQSLDQLRTLEAIVPDKIEPKGSGPSYYGSHVPTHNQNSQEPNLDDDRLELPDLDWDE